MGSLCMVLGVGRDQGLQDKALENRTSWLKDGEACLGPEQEKGAGKALLLETISRHLPHIVLKDPTAPSQNITPIYCLKYGNQ